MRKACDIDATGMEWARYTPEGLESLTGRFIN